MTRTLASRIRLFVLVAALFAVPAVVRAQQTTPKDERNGTSLTRPTVLAVPNTVDAAGASSAAPDAASATYLPIVTGLRGVLIETLDGRVVLEDMPDQALNPASAVKLATALAALRALGAQHRFTTAVWTTGTFDKQTGTITGDLIISGRDPSFYYENAVLLAYELNKAGIRTVTGDLVVAPRFTMNFDWSAQRSGDLLYDTLDVARRSAAATQAWQQQRLLIGDNTSLQVVPSVAVMGAVYVDAAPADAKLLLTHQSSKLTDILKVLLCYSNNFMAERIGETLGGPDAVRRSMINDFGINPADIRLASTSGLGVNRLSARGMLKIFRALRTELAKSGKSPADIMPVAGVDPGTLENRYTAISERGSVIAKTGTLLRTDNGASSLIGQMRTASNETLVFVILNMHGNVLRFREYQDALVAQIQSRFGGPSAFAYNPLNFSLRLANTQLSRSVQSRTDEFEPQQ